MRHLMIPSLVAMFGLTACESGAETGADDETPRQQSEAARTSGHLADGGTQRARAASHTQLRAASWVEVYAVDESGESTFAGEGAVEADGTFSVQRGGDAEPARFTVIHALDADGEIVASAVRDEQHSSTEAEASVRLDVESTVETWAFLERAEDEGDALAANLTDIQSRIDASLAAHVYAASEAGDAAMVSLTAALDAALTATLASLERDGFSGDGADLYALTASASHSLQAEIAASGDDADAYASIYAGFFAETAAAYDEAGIDAAERFEAAAASALAMDTVLAAGDGALADVGAASSGALLSGAAAEIALAQLGEPLGEAEAEAIADAVATLQADLDTAATEEEAAEAWAAYAAAVTAAFDVVLVDVTGHTDVLSEALEAMVGDVLGALEDAVAELEPARDGDAADAAAASVEATAALEAELRVMLAGTEAEVMTELLLTAAVGVMRS